MSVEIKTLKDLEDYIEENCITCEENEYGRLLYKVEFEFYEHLYDMKNVWTEYNGCEGDTIDGVDYDVPSWDVGVYGEEDDIYIYAEVKSHF